MKLLRAARWLNTSQIHRHFFAHATVNAARKRLRQLARAGYIRKFQGDRMREAVFTLGCEGKRMLEQAGSPEIVLLRQPPKQLEHLLGINDIRIAAELAGRLSYFFAAWELPAIGWRYPIIPDAIFSLAGRTFAAEFDRGAEGTRYFVKSKIMVYRRGLDGLPLAAVLVIADRKARMESLAQAVGDPSVKVLFTTIDMIRRQSLLASIFFERPADGQGTALV